MAKEFLKEYKIYITPLSYMHIGSGEELIPTNYYIDGSWLYSFNPSDIVLPKELRDELQEKIQETIEDLEDSESNDNKLCNIYRFIKTYSEQYFKSHVDSIFGIDAKLAYKYKLALNSVKNSKTEKKKDPKKKQNDNNVNNKNQNSLTVVRASHTNINQKDQPYIPGSSLKGAVSTAYIDSKMLDSDRKNESTAKDFNKNLKKTSKVNSNEPLPFSLLKISDLMPNINAYTKVMQVSRTSKKGKEITTFMETIEPGQYRSFCGTISFINDEFNKEKIIDLLSKFYQSNIHPLYQRIENKCFYHNISIHWLELYDELYKGILEERKKGVNCCLIRLGQKQGMQGLTLNYQGKKLPKTYNYVEVGNQRKDKIPLGLCLLEIDPVGDNTHLKKFCDNVQSMLPKFNLDNEYKEIAKAKEKQK